MERARSRRRAAPRDLLPGAAPDRSLAAGPGSGRPLRRAPRLLRARRTALPARRSRHRRPPRSPISRGRADRLYAADLLGAGLGCVAAIATLRFLDGASAVFACAALFAAAAFCYARRASERALFAAVAATALLVALEVSLLPWLRTAMLGADLVARIATTVLLQLPLGFVLGLSRPASSYCGAASRASCRGPGR
jgi:hypothetical protein